MKRIALLFATGALLLTAAEKRTFTGVITDTMCGANHNAMGVSPDSKCVLECVKHDKSVKFALYDGRNVYTLSDQQTPEKYAGQKVKITGTLYEKTKILQVDSIEPAAGGK
jgi:hypothetical protein